MKKCMCLIAILLFLCVGLNAFCMSDKKSERVFCKEKANGNYIVYYINSKGKQIQAMELPKKPSINQHPNFLVEYGISTGSPGSYSWFINLKSDRVSKGFFEVMAIEPYKYYVATMEDNLKSIIIYSIFNEDKPVLKIKRNFTGDVFDSVKDAKFVKGNLFYIKYLHGEDRKIVEEYIKIK